MRDTIGVKGARENNLKDVSLRLPKRNIIIFTGVSGSGKSSLVFDTIANEAQRLLFENFSLFIENSLVRWSHGAPFYVPTAFIRPTPQRRVPHGRRQHEGGKAAREGEHGGILYHGSGAGDERFIAVRGVLG